MTLKEMRQAAERKRLVMQQTVIRERMAMKEAAERHRLAIAEVRQALEAVDADVTSEGAGPEAPKKLVTNQGVLGQPLIVFVPTP